MSQRNAIIRPYTHETDNKLVRFMVAKAAMEPLAVANRKATMHPIAVSLWIALSCVWIQVLNWWPDPRLGFLVYLRPLPAFAALTLPIMFFIDWYQRHQFEKHSTDALKRPDIVDITEYYTRTPASGIWIYDFGDQFVGLVAVDASEESLSDDALSSSQASQDSNSDRSKPRTRSQRKASEKTASSTAVIRHFYIAEPYRVADAQGDMIAFATKRVFETNNVERIRISPSPLMDYIARSLNGAGFDVVNRGEKIGILGWTTLTYELARSKWENLQRDDS